MVMKVPPFQSKSETEQIKLIFDNLGFPAKQDFPNLNLGNNVVEISGSKSAFFTKMPTDFVESDGFDLLKKMFVFNQNERITAKEALNHCYFFQKC